MKRILLAVILAGMFVCGHYYAHHYTRVNCTVVSAENGYVKIKDNTGNIWNYDNSNLIVGDKVDLKMHDNCTDKNIKDDIIIKIIKR